jgi:MFS family permease
LSDRAPSPFRDALSLLGPGPFRRYMIGESVSMTGTWMQMMAQSWVVTTLTSSALMLGVINFASGVPMLLLSMIGGTFADRHDKRAILMICLGVQIALSIVMGGLILTGQIAIWHVIAIAALLGIVNAFEMPAVSALVPELVSKDRIKDAIALDRALFHATRLVGPAIAGVVIAAFGNAVAFFVNAFSFVPLIIALLTLPPRPTGTAEEEEARTGGMGDALMFVRTDRPTLAMVALMAANTLFVFPIMMVLLPLYAKVTLGLGAGGFGTLMSAAALGSLVGSLGLMGVAPAQRLSRLVMACAGATVAVGVLAAAQHLLLAMAALAVMSVALSTLFGLANTIVIERTPVPLRGRVSAVIGIASFGLMPFAGLAVSAYADAIGMRGAIATGAAAFGLVSAAVLMMAGRHVSEAPERAAEHAEPAPVETP